MLFKETQNILERIFSKNIDNCKVGFGFKGTECFNISTNELSNDLQANYVVVGRHVDQPPIKNRGPHRVILLIFKRFLMTKINNSVV